MRLKTSLIAVLASTVIGISAGCAGGTGSSGDAAGFPSKSVRLIIPYAADGPTDTVARALARYWEEELGWNVVPENLIGAAGAIGMNAAIKAEPDGHTLVITGTTAAVVAPLQVKDAGYGPKDFMNIGSITQYPFVIAAGKESGSRTADEFFKKAKADPGALAIGAPAGVGQTTVDFMRLEEEGVKLTTVPFNGNSQAIAALLGNNVDGVVQTASQDILAQIKAGVAIPIAVMSKERAPYLPDVPTLAELGFGVDQGVSYYGLGASAGVSDETTEILEDALREALKDPKTRKQIGELFIAKDFIDGDALTKIYAEQRAYYGSAIKKLAQ